MNIEVLHTEYKFYAGLCHIAIHTQIIALKTCTNSYIKYLQSYIDMYK